MLSITLLGTGAACPSVERNVAALAIVREGETLIFDCGEGTQRQMMRYGVSFAFREIFFTHYHADHMLGVTGLMRTMGLQDRTLPVTLYGPRGAAKILGAAIALGIERNRFPIEIVELQAGDRIRRDEYDIVVFPTDHRADTVGYAVVEHTRLGRFNPERAREIGIPEGPLWGKLHKGETVELSDGRRVGPEELVGKPRRGRSVVYTGDTRPALGVVEAARGADLLAGPCRRDGAFDRRAGGGGRARGRRAPAGADPHQPALQPRRPRATGRSKSGVPGEHRRTRRTHDRRAICRINCNCNCSYGG
jgi:ribonuclease Z